MSFDFPAHPDLPDLNQPDNYNARVLAGFQWCFQTMPNYLEGLSAQDFFPVQSTLTDATPDRVLLNGGHGVGGNGVAPPNFNLDDIAVSGIYNVSSSVIAASTLPGVTIQSGSSVLAMVFNTSNQAQMLIVHPGGKLFHRIKDAGVWTGWFEGLAVDPVTGRVGVGTTAPTGILEVNASRQFDPADANSNSHLNIVQAGGTPGEGNYGASVVLSKIASGRPGGAMASVQTGPDPDQMGLSFFTHLSSTASDILAEQFRIDHSGAMLARVWEGVCAASGLGAVMESGSNANGQYWRFANGVQIQQRSVSIDMAATGAVSFDLPAANTGRVGAFISAGVQEALPFATAQTLDVVVTMPSDGSSWSVSPAAWAATTGTYNFMLISIDRWK